MSMKRLMWTTSVLALGLAGTAFAQSGAGSSAGAGSMGTSSGSPAYSTPSTTSGSGLGGTRTPANSGSSMNNENGSGANGGPMASTSTGSSRSQRGGDASSNVRQAQEALQDQGLYKGQVDGKMGPETKHAIAQFQKQKGLKQTAQLDQPTLNDLQNGAMSGSDNASGSPSSSGSRSPNSSPSDNSGSGASPGMGGNGPATTDTNPGGANRMPAH